jgi:predicted dehydrogenase
MTPARAPSRRELLAKSALTASAIALAPHARGQENRKKVGYCVVGIGSLTKNQIVPALAKCEHAKLVALVSGHAAEKAPPIVEKYGLNPQYVYSYENFNAIRDNPEIDVVYVVLPNSMHEEYTIRAHQAGKHVLCEKPMANSVAECARMIEAARAAGKKLMIGYRLRHEPVNMRAIDLVRGPGASGADTGPVQRPNPAADPKPRNLSADMERQLEGRGQGAIGPIKGLEAGAGFNIGDPKQWRLNKKLAGGGSMMDIGIYALNACRYLSGEEPVEVTASTYSTPGDERFREVEETMLFTLRFKSGLLANCTSTYGYGINRYRVTGTKGIVQSEPFLSYSGVKLFTQLPGQKEIQEVKIEQKDHFAAEMDYFAECVRDGKEVRTPGEEGMRDLRVIEACYRSAQSGRMEKV